MPTEFLSQLLDTFQAIPPGTWAAFLLAAWALNFTPGPDVLFIIANTLSGGRRVGIAAGVGVSCGSIVHVALAVLGVATIIRDSETTFLALRLVGAAYLMWLAVSFWRAPPLVAGQAPVASGADARRAFLRGAQNCVLNPKVSAFVLAFLPQFTDPARGPVSQQVLILGLGFCLASVLPHVVWALAAAGLGSALRRLGRWMNRISAGIMALLALGLVWQRG